MKAKLIYFLIMAQTIVTGVSGQVQFDLTRVPFSYKGAIWAVSLKNKTDLKQVLVFREITGKTGAFESGEVFTVEFPNDSLVEYKATPSLIEVISPKGKTQIVFYDKHTLRVRGSLPVKLTTVNEQRWGFFTMPNKLDSQKDKSFSILSPDFASFRFTQLAGYYTASSAKIREKEPEMKVYNIHVDEKGVLDFVIEEFESGWDPKRYDKPFEACVASSQKDFLEFKSKMPSVPVKYDGTALLASYVDWSCCVSPTGLFRREAMLMSKNWMHSVWSWDHCFNAMALMYGHPDLAWDQFMIMYDYQDEKGNLPDLVNPTAQFMGVTKPPVHGWAFKKLMQIDGLVTSERLVQAYTVLSRQVNYWMKYRDSDGNGIPEYHFGVDSGWDNATVFDSGSFVEGPDLCAYLVYQMDVLSEIAVKLKKTKEASEWKKKSDALLAGFIDRLWTGEGFVTRTVGSKDYNLSSQSLINYMPVVLGKRLPAPILGKLISSLKTSGLITAYGLATENPASSKYEPDGYWRGPIWAPTTLILADGLRASGETTLATEIAEKFCNMCLDNGFGENFDALTGKPYRDPAYTWTSSVFLVLAHEYILKTSAKTN